MNEIILTETEKRWIKFCKGHYQDIYPFICYENRKNS